MPDKPKSPDPSPDDPKPSPTDDWLHLSDSALSVTPARPPVSPLHDAQFRRDWLALSGLDLTAQAGRPQNPNQPAGDSGTLFIQAAYVYSGVAAEKAAADSKTAELYALRAIEMLRQAHAAGYFQTTEHRENLKTATELNALRGRRDFQQLLRTIES